MNWIASNRPVASEIKHPIGRGPYGSRPILMVEQWKQQQRHPNHDLRLTVLNITGQGAFILVEDPMGYLMGPERKTKFPFYGNALMLFRVIHNFYPKDATIQQLSLEPANGC